LRAQTRATGQQQRRAMHQFRIYRSRRGLPEPGYGFLKDVPWCARSQMRYTIN
jgi:hypothetical protein